MARVRSPKASKPAPISSRPMAWVSIWSRAICSANPWGSRNFPDRARCWHPAPGKSHERSFGAKAYSLKRHVETFRDVGAEAGADGDAAPNFLRGGIGGPDRIAAGPEERIGVRRLGLGGVERIMRVGLE